MKSQKNKVVFICACAVLLMGFGDGRVCHDEFTVKPELQKGDQDRMSDVQSVGVAKPTVGRNRRTCFKCGGSGTVAVSEREDCDRCDGTGIVITEVELKDTEHTFDGWRGPRTKKVTRKAQNKQPCPRCGRRGKISVKKEIECPLCKGKGQL